MAIPALSDVVRSGASAFAGGGVVVSSATLNVPVGAGVLEWSETITDASVLVTSRVHAWLAPSTDDTDENDPELLDVMALWASALAGGFTAGLTFSQPCSGPIRLHYTVT